MTPTNDIKPSLSGMIMFSRTGQCLLYSAYVRCGKRLRPYHVENTGSCLITQVKQRRARSVLGWVTAWEHRVPSAFSFSHLASGCRSICCVLLQVGFRLHFCTRTQEAADKTILSLCSQAAVITPYTHASHTTLLWVQCGHVTVFIDHHSL